MTAPSHTPTSYWVLGSGPHPRPSLLCHAIVVVIIIVVVSAVIRVWLRNEGPLPTTTWLVLQVE